MKFPDNIGREARIGRTQNPKTPKPQNPISLNKLLDIVDDASY
jgi:hypothetical protein